MGVRHVFSWWFRTRLLRQVHKALESTAASPPAPRALLEGTGVIVLPSDPVQTALQSLVIRDLCNSLAHPVRLAGSPSSLRWIPACGCGIPVQMPDSKSSPREFAEWLEYNRAHRADWSLLASPEASPMEEAVFFWLGRGPRFAPPEACPGGSGNIILSTHNDSKDLDSSLRSLLRVVRPQMPSLRTRPRTPGGPVVLELPDDLPEKGSQTRKWATAITQMSTATPILLAHFDPLPTSISELLRGLGSRVAITHLANADETLALAEHARIWIGPRSPATALATLAQCPVNLIGNQKSASDYPDSPNLTISGKIVWQGTPPTV